MEIAPYKCQFYNQVGYVKGQNITNNIRTVSDLMFLTKNENIGGMIIGIDFQKAFDCKLDFFD